MNKKILVYGLLGLLSSGAAAGFVVANSQQGQALPASRDSQQPRSMRVDQHFIEMMIPHHRDAIAMADLALTRAKRPEVKRLAEAIKKDQAYEIQEMRTWYKQWYGKEAPAPSMAGMGMGQGMMNMETDLAALKKASDFDKEFVRQMIPHHQMAVMMAQMASKRATRPEIRTLAQSIIKSQNAEIAQMQGWQQAWNR